jgi:hypothetical protein
MNYPGQAATKGSSGTAKLPRPMQEVPGYYFFFSSNCVYPFALPYSSFTFLKYSTWPFLELESRIEQFKFMTRSLWPTMVARLSGTVLVTSLWRRKCGCKEFVKSFSLGQAVASEVSFNPSFKCA